MAPGRRTGPPSAGKGQKVRLPQKRLKIRLRLSLNAVANRVTGDLDIAAALTMWSLHTNTSMRACKVTM